MFVNKLYKTGFEQKGVSQGLVGPNINWCSKKNVADKADRPNFKSTMTVWLVQYS